MIIETPAIFDYDQCLRYFTRSDQEPLFRVDNKRIYRLLEIGSRRILLCIQLDTENNLSISFPDQKPVSEVEKSYIKAYVCEWFDLETSLEDFYNEVSNDPIFSGLIEQQYGSRMIRVPDLFEALSWSIIGQQINLRFAYQIKKALVEGYGDHLNFDGVNYYLFPTPDKVLNISDEEFKELQFSRQKMNYIRIVAEALLSKQLNKQELLTLGPDDAKAEMIKLKGIGNWSANYVMMRCLGFKEAFPVEDVGLHNALKQQLGLEKKPTTEEVREISKGWDNWKGYRTYYLWNSLLKD